MKAILLTTLTLLVLFANACGTTSGNKKPHDRHGRSEYIEYLDKHSF